MENSVQDPLRPIRYLVMPLGLTNALTTFHHFLNDMLQNILDQYVVYLDILFFSNSPEQHSFYAKIVLVRLQQHGLYAKSEKYAFY